MSACVGSAPRSELLESCSSVSVGTASAASAALEKVPRLISVPPCLHCALNGLLVLHVPSVVMARDVVLFNCLDNAVRVVLFKFG